MGGVARDDSGCAVQNIVEETQTKLDKAEDYAKSKGKGKGSK